MFAKKPFILFYKLKKTELPVRASINTKFSINILINIYTAQLLYN